MRDSSEYRVDGRKVDEKEYTKKLKSVGLLVKSRNFLVFQNEVRPRTLPHSGRQTFLMLTCRVCYTNPSTVERERSLAHQNGGPGSTETAHSLVLQEEEVRTARCDFARWDFAYRGSMADILALPHLGQPTILKLTCWVCGTNPSSLERDSARAQLDCDRPRCPVRAGPGWWISEHVVCGRERGAVPQHAMRESTGWFCYGGVPSGKNAATPWIPPGP